MKMTKLIFSAFLSAVLILNVTANQPPLQPSNVNLATGSNQVLEPNTYRIYPQPLQIPYEPYNAYQPPNQYPDVPQGNYAYQPPPAYNPYRSYPSYHIYPNVAENYFNNYQVPSPPTYASYSPPLPSYRYPVNNEYRQYYPYPNTVTANIQDDYAYPVEPAKNLYNSYQNYYRYPTAVLYSQDANIIVRQALDNTYQSINRIRSIPVRKIVRLNNNPRVEVRDSTIVYGQSEEPLNSTIPNYSGNEYTSTPVSLPSPPSTAPSSQQKQPKIKPVSGRTTKINNNVVTGIDIFQISGSIDVNVGEIIQKMKELQQLSNQKDAINKGKEFIRGKVCKNNKSFPYNAQASSNMSLQSVIDYLENARTRISLKSSELANVLSTETQHNVYKNLSPSISQYVQLPRIELPSVPSSEVQNQLNNIVEEVIQYLQSISCN